MTERPQPEISVVVPTRDRAARLERLLEALRAQTFGAFELIVVDDASSDSTRALLEREAGRGNLTLRVIHRDQPGGPALARNDGWAAARAPLVAFTDDDCVPSPGWLAALARTAAERPGSFVQGPTEPDRAEREQLGPFSRTVEVEALGPYYQTCNIAYPRALLERLGGFDARTFPFVGEDADLAWRALAAGANAAWAPEARVRHAVNRLGPRGRLRVAARWGDSVELLARHPGFRSEQLTYGLFWKGTHYLFARALAGLVLRRRAPAVALWLAVPYVWNLFERTRVEGGGPLAAPWYLLEDAVEVAGVLRGAVRSRTPVL